jgi:hypothetical protein
MEKKIPTYRPYVPCTFIPSVYELINGIRSKWTLAENIAILQYLLQYNLRNCNISQYKISRQYPALQSTIIWYQLFILSILDSDDLACPGRPATRAETNIRKLIVNTKYSNGYLVFEYSFTCMKRCETEVMQPIILPQWRNETV